MTTYKGNHITNFDSQPSERVDSRLHGGLVKNAKDAFELPSLSGGDIAIVFKVPIDAIIHRVRFGCDALTSGNLNVGIFKKNNDGTYEFLDLDAYANFIDVTSAVAISDITFERDATNIVNATKPLWERAELTSRPDYGDLYIGFHSGAGTGAAGTVYLEIDYTE